MDVVYFSRDFQFFPLDHRTSYGTNSLQSAFGLFSVLAPTTQKAIHTHSVSWRNVTAHRCPSCYNALSKGSTAGFSVGLQRSWSRFSFHHETKKFGCIGEVCKVWMSHLGAGLWMGRWLQSPEVDNVRKEGNIFKFGLDPKIFFVFWENVPILESLVKWALARRESSLWWL